ncbi:hypothetical protein L6164_036379 [Bauhinia variegata]|uniref:Uncharacterized protein n=1 Tax=Bauhinia variegata TaxID=167791 RepID=A0ACB9KGZ7_BAUVA|nr:hypothetical protein L6164_036379 [Bauhinia variegata]
MDLGYGSEAKGQSKMKHLQSGRITLNSDTVLVFTLPEAQVLRIISRSLFLAIVFVAFSCLGSIFRVHSLSSSHAVVSGFGTAFDSIDFELLNLLFNDLADEGFIRKGDKALFVSPSLGFGNVIQLKNNEVDVVIDSDFERQSSFPNKSYDFVFTSNYKDAEFIDRILKDDGIVALTLGNNQSLVFKEQPNYRVVYLRRYMSIIVALRKTKPANAMEASSTERKLFQLTSEAKKMALKGFEDVLLEPPRRALAKSKKYLKKIKYLPELLGDSLEGYKRRVFISVGLPEENKYATKWFQKNYPKKNQKFVIHNLQAQPEEASYRVVPPTDVSLWLSKRVKEEDYVVVKAEAEVVEEMLKKKTIQLVDELFLECKNEWWQNGKRNKSGSRAYWECLNLYGRLRDEGVAVHQWWG